MEPGLQLEKPRGPSAPARRVCKAAGGALGSGGDECHLFASCPRQRATRAGACRTNPSGPPHTEGRPGPRAQRISMKPALSQSHGTARAQPTPDPRNPACQGPRGAVGPSSWGAGVLQLAVAGLPGKVRPPQAASRMPSATPTVTVGRGCLLGDYAEFWVQPIWVLTPLLCWTGQF